MGHFNKRTWGGTILKYCPESKRVWELKHDPQIKAYKIIIHYGLPSFGLERKKMPKNL